jgi:1,4-alpha-glucan branching enzyme
MSTPRTPDATGAPAEIIAVGSWHDILAADRRAETAGLLLDYAAERRWFRGKARKRKGAAIEDVIPLSMGATGYSVVLLRVDYEDGGKETYVLPLGLASRQQAARVMRRSPHAVLGTLSVRDVEHTDKEIGRGVLIDALATEELASLLLTGISAETSWNGEQGELEGAKLASLAERTAGVDPKELAPRIADTEQTNTSLFFGKTLFLKVFRLIEEGQNADYEVGRFLTERRGFRGTARVAGGIEYRRRGREPSTFAMLQELIPNKGDAWKVTLDAVGRFFERARLEGAAFNGAPPMPEGSLFGTAKAEPPQSVVGLIGSYLASARRLGARTAELHLALGGDAEDPVFAPEPLTQDAQAEMARAAEALLNKTFETLRARIEVAPESAREVAAGLLGRQDEIREKLQKVASEPVDAARIRCHGDYHLGQVLATGDDFVIIDFEGEPGRGIEERRRKDSPLRDVAGMLRSYHYAGASALRQGRVEAASIRALEPFAEAWTAWISAAYLRGYLEVASGSPLLPSDDAKASRLLDFYLLDKCVYEVNYELNNRPDWVEIPLRGLLRILGPGSSLEAGAAPGAAEGDAGAAEADPHAGEPALPEVSGSLLGEMDLHYFHEGSHRRMYEKLGAHAVTRNGVEGVLFGVWAPNAQRVSVIGDFNGWDPYKDYLEQRGSSGIWEGFIPEAKIGSQYKFHIESKFGGYRVDKADPFGYRHSPAPATESVVAHLDYRWGDGAWMKSRAEKNRKDAPMSIYEIHLGSWMRVPEEGNRMLSYREIAPKLAEYVKKMGFTHVELLPITEHPFYGSWGYETTGYFAASSRYGTPQDLMFLVDTLHKEGIGVILDWVPAHFPTDEHGLGFFDGTHLFEHEDVRQGLHRDWNTFIFNYGRHEVRSFLLSSALFWLDRYHFDGLRVDGVASMLYLDYGRREGEWIPNAFGGRENLEAVAFLKHLNDAICRERPDTVTIAEESTSWPMVSRPTHVGGLGFTMKWDLGWMHDTLEYLARDPVFRKYHHNQLTFRGMYAFSENFVLPLSHDEVVHGKGSLIGKMNGDHWQKLANLRLLFAYMYAQPGKKLLFMGSELGSFREWNHDTSLDWHLAEAPLHKQLPLFLGELNHIYREERSLHELDFDPRGFVWIDANDAEHSVLAFERRAADPKDSVVVLFNLTPVVRANYRVGVPQGGVWREILNSDAEAFGGSGVGNFGGVEAVPVRWHGREWSLNLVLPPLGAIFLKRDRTARPPGSL